MDEVVVDRGSAILRLDPGEPIVGVAGDLGDQMGGEGASLARLIAEVYPVPSTGLVTTVAYRAVAAEPEVADLVGRIVGGEGAPVDEVDRIFATVTIDPALEASIGELARAVGEGGGLAIRSSATVEDLGGSSFAGQYRSILDVDSTNERAMLAAVRQVWASLWHPAPTAYRRAFGIAESDVAMAVVCMAMVPATTAGVVFTTDPGGSDGARVEAVAGPGEALVSGERIPKAWVVPTRDGAVSRAPVDPPVAVRTALGLALDVATSFGVPQDVEWAAIGDDDVYLVQARPITVLDDQDGFDSPVDDHELTTAGIVEMVPGVVPPLRWELNRFVLEEAFRSVLDTLGIIRGSAAEDRPLIRRVRGQVAMDFDLLRDVAAGIPGAVHELEQQYFGRDKARDGQWVTRGRRRLSPGGIGQDLRAFRAERQMDQQAEVTVRAVDLIRIRRPFLAGMGSGELVAYVRRLTDLAARCLTAELAVAAGAAAVFRSLELQLSSYLGPQEGALAAQQVTAIGGSVVRRERFASAAIFGGPTWLELELPPPTPPRPRPLEQRRSRRALEQRLTSLPGWTRRRILTGQIIDTRIHLIRRRAAEVVEKLQRREATKAAFLELGGEARRVVMDLGRRGRLDRAGCDSTSSQLGEPVRGRGPSADSLRRCTRPRARTVTRRRSAGGLGGRSRPATGYGPGRDPSRWAVRAGQDPGG